jgi:anti-sigma B factor antagonist
MSETGLSVVSERRGSGWHIAACGELDIATVELLERDLIAAEQTDADTIVLDLRGLSFIDSTGLKLLLDANDRSADTDRLRMIAGSPALERLLDIVGLRERLPLIAP